MEIIPVKNVDEVLKVVTKPLRESNGSKLNKFPTSQKIKLEFQLAIKSTNQNIYSCFA